MELIRPTKQEVWGWPGVVNLVLGGMSAGFYLLSSLVIVLQSGVPGLAQPAWFKLLAPALTGLGFLALTIEAGHPLRARHLLRRLCRSWMSRETLAGIIFIPVAALDWFFPHPVLWALAAVSAMGLMISQGFVFHRIRAVPAWNAPLVPLLFLSSGFATGSGLALLTVSGRLTMGMDLALISLGCIVIDLGVWFLYLRWSNGVAFGQAVEVLRRSRSRIFTVGVGHLAPILLLSLSLVVPGVGLGRVAATLAGLAMIAGGASLKSDLVLRAGYMRGIVLGRPKGETQNASLALAAPRSVDETY